MSYYTLDMYSGELYHYGIKGQKWGVRRWQNKDGSLTPEGYEHYSRKLRKLKRAKDFTNESANATWEQTKILAPLAATLTAVVAPPSLIAAGIPATAAVLSGLSVAGMAGGYVGGYGGAMALGQKICIGLLGLKIKSQTSKLNNSKKKTVAHSDDELMHFGIKGQKHGRRRWQNEDGSLTPEGYVHYGYGKHQLKGIKKRTSIEGVSKSPRGIKEGVDSYEQKVKEFTDLHNDGWTFDNKKYKYSDISKNFDSKKYGTVNVKAHLSQYFSNMYIKDFYKNTDNYIDKAMKSIADPKYWTNPNNPNDWEPKTFQIYDKEATTVWLQNKKDPSSVIDVDFDDTGKVIW